MPRNPSKEEPQPNKRRKRGEMEMDFSYQDKVRTTQPHNDAFVVTLLIEGYQVKWVMVD